jgi:hypothetical protein
LRIEVDQYSTYQEFRIPMIFFCQPTSAQEDPRCRRSGVARHPDGRRPRASPRMPRHALVGACARRVFAREKSSPRRAKKGFLSLGKAFLLH